MLLAEQIATIDKKKTKKIGQISDRSLQKEIFKCFIHLAAYGEKDEDLKELPLNSTTEEYENVASIADYIQSYSPEDRAEIAREINNGEISIKCK